MSRRKVLCVSTSKPSSSLTPGGGGGSIIILCPQTGNVLSSLRATGDTSSKTMVGVSSLSKFPEKYATLGPPLMMAFGGTTSKRDDTYGMLLSLRSGSSPPLLHWKCRLPEAQLSAGIIVSPCDNYIVGGGASGTCFVWSALGGSLLRTVKAHYRSVTTMSWSDCGSFLVTGGADGLVHVFSLLDLVERNDNGAAAAKTVSPIRTWSVHHLPVSALLTMPSGRMISASQDGQVVMLELFSQKVIFTIQMPLAIHALACSGRRLFAGSIRGSVYLIDLDQYAVHETAQLGVTIKHVSEPDTNEDQVFSTDRSEAYKTELLGHEKPITSLAVLTEDDCEWLISGDEAGEIRIWDLESRGCVRVIQPWAHSGVAVTAASASGKTPGSSTKPALHPVTSILIVPRDDEVEKKQDSTLGSFGVSSKEGKTRASIIKLVTPLQRFTDRDDDTTDDKCGACIPVPFLRPKRNRGPTVNLTSASNYAELLNHSSKRPRPSQGSEGKVDPETKGKDVDTGEPNLSEQTDEVQRLRQELEEARSTIQRWEKVNNKLMTKLKQSQS